ncbi:MAG TPA: helix-turn-helix transcriptional regulator [Anaerolineae bacterium]|nr:helix-turn-helix transcriptional regulator [Anaerolineae bacterium]
MSIRDSLPTARVEQSNSSDSDEHLLLHVNGDLCTRLCLAAEARDQTPAALASDLLQRGLEQETLRAHSELLLDKLTPREQEVVRLTLRGLTNYQISDRLVISPETVKTHVRHALEKLGMRSKTELRMRWLEAGILPANP